MAQPRRARRSATPRTRRRTWNARRADTTAAGAALALGPLYVRWRGGLARLRAGRLWRHARNGGSRGSCLGPAAGQPMQADLGDLALDFEVCAERGGTRRGQPVRPAPVVALKRLDHAVCLKSAQRFVERAGRESDTRERFDVLGERVPVLGAVSQTRQDKAGRAR